MKKYGKYRKIIISSLLILIFTSCTKKEYTDNYNRQITALKSYMGTLPSGYIVRDDDVYVALTADNSAVGAEPVQPGDKISLWYAEYILQGSRLGTLVWTNNEYLAEEAKWTPDGDTDYRPVEFTYGDAGLVKGLETGLRGCKKGQEFIIAMPFSKAYGDKWISTVPPYSAIAFYVMIENIIKKE